VKALFNLTYLNDIVAIVEINMVMMGFWGQAMDNFRRGLHSYLGAGAKTSLGVCLTELKH
jgi:hypothetical protein